AGVPDLESIRADLGEPRTVLGDGNGPAGATGVLPEDPVFLQILENDSVAVAGDERDRRPVAHQSGNVAEGPHTAGEQGPGWLEQLEAPGNDVEEESGSSARR